MTLYIVTTGTCSRCRRLDERLEARNFNTKFLMLDSIREELPTGKSLSLPIVKVNQKFFFYSDYRSLDRMEDEICDYMNNLAIDPIDDDESIDKPVKPIEPVEPKETESDTEIKQEECTTDCEIKEVEDTTTLVNEPPFPKPDTKSYSDKVFNYFTAQFRYWFTRADWVEDQAEWRRRMIKEHSPYCLEKKECIICECPIGADLGKATLEYGDDGCEGGCFPNWMSKKEWINFKVNAGI